MLLRVFVLSLCLLFAGVMSLGCGSESSQRKAEPEPTEAAEKPQAQTPARKPAPKIRPERPEPAADQALLTVYSSPQGQIVVAGQDTGKKTPGTVEIKVGEVNQVQVRFDDGVVSEAKEVTGEAGRRFKVFIKRPAKAQAE